MENLSDTRFEKRLKRIAKILNSDQFHFGFIGNSLIFYDQLSKIIKIISNNRGIAEDRDWQIDRLIILDSVLIHICQCLPKRSGYQNQIVNLKRAGLSNG